MNNINLTKLLRTALSIILLFIASNSHAIEILSSKQALQQTQEIARKIDKLLEDDLYAIEEVIPGYQQPGPFKSSVIIADFEDLSGDENIMWGRVLARIMRFHLNYVPQDDLKIPSFFYYDSTRYIAPPDYGIRKNTVEELVYLARSMGIRNMISGSVDIDGSEYTINLELKSLDNSNSNTKKFLRTGAASDLISGFNAVSKEIYTSLVPDVTAETETYLNQGLDFGYVNLGSLAKSLTTYLSSDQDEKKLEALSPYWEKEKTHPLILLHYLEYMKKPETDEELEERNQFLTTVFREYPQSRAIAFRIAMAKGISSANSNSFSKKISLLKAYVKDYPRDVDGYIELAIMLADKGMTYDAVTVGSQGLKIHTTDYRMIWNYASIINKQAWNIRGNGYWDDVPERAKELFPPLSDFAHDLTIVGISRNERVMGLRTLHIGTMNEFSEKMMEAFYEGLEVDPTNWRFYKVTINYAQPNWHGSEEAVRRVWSLAIENNPDEDWPYILRDQFSPGAVREPSFIRDIYPLIGCEDKTDCSEEFNAFLITIFLAIVLLILLITSWVAKKKEAAEFASRYQQPYQRLTK